MEPHKLSKHQEQTKAQLEALPAKILHHAQVFQEHVQYFAGNGNTSNEITVPDGVKRLMDDIVGAEKLGEKIKAEILQDDDARQVRRLVRSRVVSEMNISCGLDSVYIGNRRFVEMCSHPLHPR